MRKGASATLEAGRGVALAALLGVSGLVPGPAAPQAPDAWRWPGEAVTCAASGPDSVMDVFMAGAATPAGRHVLRRCRSDSADSPAAVVTSRFRFAKRLALVSTMDIAVDHSWTEWRRDGRLIRLVAHARGGGACGSLVSGECRFELAAEEGGADRTLRRSGERGERVEAVPADALNNTMWNAEIVRARTIVDVYTGHVWTMRGAPDGAPDLVDGRPARRHHIRGEPKGFPWFASRYERVLWFDPEGEVLRVCDFHKDYGIDNLAEFVRADLGIAPRHDCARWFE